MARKPAKTDRIRTAVIGFIVILVVGVGGYGLLYSSGVTDSGEIAEGDTYREVEGTRRRTTGPVEITEFFSYGCIHCRNFDAVIDDWKDSLGDDMVFKRVHVAYSPYVTQLARVHLTLQQVGALEANHGRIFRAIHDRGTQFLSGEMIADFVDGFGTSKEEFLRVFNSDRIRDAAASSDARFRALELTGVPSLVVGDRYVIDMNVGRKRSLDVAVELAKRELAERAAAGGAD